MNDRDKLPQPDQQSFLLDPVSNLPFGDDLNSSKPNHTVRILFNNVNGIYKSQNWSSFTNFIKTAKSLSIDIIGLAETNVKWDQRKLKTSRNICQRFFKSSNLNAS